MAGIDINVATENRLQQSVFAAKSVFGKERGFQDPAEAKSVITPFSKSGVPRSHRVHPMEAHAQRALVRGSPCMLSTMITATGLPARVGYGLLSFPVGALAGYFLALRLLIRFGSIFKDPHPSMQGFGYFMMSLAAAVTLAVTAFLFALTLPWKRPAKPEGKILRIVISVLVVGFGFLVLVGQGNALIFALALTGWLTGVFYLTYIRHGVLDPKQPSCATP